jgi:hypothetical protein
MWTRDNKPLIVIFNALFWVGLVGWILGLLLLLYLLIGKNSSGSIGYLIALFVISSPFIFLNRFLRNFFKKELNKQDVAIDKPKHPT